MSKTARALIHLILSKLRKVITCLEMAYNGFKCFQVNRKCLNITCSKNPESLKSRLWVLK